MFCHIGFTAPVGPTVDCVDNGSFRSYCPTFARIQKLGVRLVFVLCAGLAGVMAAGGRALLNARATA